MHTGLKIFLWGCGAVWGCLTASVAGARTLELTFRLEASGQPMRVGAAGTSPVGANQLRVTRASALVSRVTLVRADGGRVQAEGQVGWIDLGSGRTALTVTGLPAGSYVRLEFILGVSPETNRADPGQWPAGHALNPLVNGLHWGWQGGYVFVALEGHFLDERGVSGGWSYHLATDARRMLVALDVPIALEDDAVIDLAWDLARTFDGLRLRSDDGTDSTHSAPRDPVADRLVQTVPRSFRVDQVRARVAGPESASSAPRVSTGTGTPVAFRVPAGWPQPSLPEDNTLTEEGVELGRDLFADPRLSGGGTQSCVDCHAPERSFSDAVALSRGEKGAVGTRNSMPLVNLAWSPRFGWDAGRETIRSQVLAAITHPLEMAADLMTVTQRLQQDPALAGRFAVAFGDPTVTPDRIGRALEQYLLSLVAVDSRFDRAMRGTDTLSADELRGFELFMTESDPARGRRGADCFHCHGGALFTDFSTRNNGLDRVSADPGRGAVTQKFQDAGAFKVPSLRNVALTAPYMHDGRHPTLEAVMAHYNQGVLPSATLDPNLAKHPPEGLGLSESDQRALVAFLRTLTSPVSSALAGD